MRVMILCCVVSKVPTGISKLKALQTLRVVNVARGKATFQELRELTQLRKLRVVGAGGKNNKKFWHGHNRLLNGSTGFRT